MVEADKKSLMEYRYLGNTGIKVSAISFGNMVNHLAENAQASLNEIVARCLEYGVNFFDTAEAYAGGLAETQLGQSFIDLKVRREDIVVSTKLFFGTEGIFSSANPPVNGLGLSRKHIIEGTRNSLKRLQLSYVDVIYAHRYDQHTPLEEVVRAFSWVVDQGLAFYWGTSEWNSDQIAEAILFARAHGLHEPVTEQPQYSMLIRDRFEKEYGTTIFEKYRYGSTVWSPLGQGVLTGRYNDGNVAEGRFTQDPTFKDFILGQFFSPAKKEKSIQILQGLAELSQELGYTQSQLALAWALANKDVSTLILGFSKVSYVDENLKALELYRKWNKEIEQKCEALLSNQPQGTTDYRTFAPNATRRTHAVFNKK
ncbi:aldo keto reductase family protein [Stylonychia lemnae]|uniref:Aldo keto reductase family protein n=1 Tax=Stylonychia lemnae TaxID=5949 RepID=A0A077ZSG8_STYLE|nr:aldo keto reductase family protein [Stylonychia lemnae]|eukprot:CDW71416.1 aldo keto reductase family protein [Stylonychia lemnae]